MERNNEIIRVNWETGVKLHVLGQGIKTFYPCIAFFVGDDPQQHRQAGIQEGNATHFCTYCIYKHSDGIYNPNDHLPRNYDEIREDCIQAEQLVLKKSNNQILSALEKRLIDKLRKQNIHPYSNPTFNAPMGTMNNNIFMATPPDTMHLFCAGLMKSLGKSIITIVHTLSNTSHLSNSNSCILDSRLAGIGYVHDMPHVNWTMVTGGIMRYVESNVQERGQSTGSFCGFKSTTFISLLIQIYYCIIPVEDILPSKDITINAGNRGIIVKDMKGRVLRAIYSLLDVYFEVKRTEWDDNDISNLKKKINNRYDHYMLVWDLRQLMIKSGMKSLIETLKVNKQRNPHKLYHLDVAIQMYGCPPLYAGETWEAAHQVFTTSIYRTTSRRQTNMCIEMLKKYNLNYYTKMFENISKVHSKLNDITEYMKKEEHDDEVSYEVVQLSMKIPLWLECNVDDKIVNIIIGITTLWKDIY